MWLLCRICNRRNHVQRGGERNAKLSDYSRRASGRCCLQTGSWCQASRGRMDAQKGRTTQPPRSTDPQVRAQRTGTVRQLGSAPRPPPAPRDSHYSPPAACGAGLIYGSFQARGGNIQRGPEMHEVLKLPDSHMKCNPPGAGGARRRIQRLWCARPLFTWTAPAPLQHKADCARCITSIMQRQGNKTWLGAAAPTCLSLTREISFFVLTFHLFCMSRIWFLDLFL